MSEDDPLSRPSGREFGFGPIMVALLLLVTAGIAGVVGLIFLAPDLVEVSPGGAAIAHHF